jgi:hypothetical protein
MSSTFENEIVQAANEMAIGEVDDSLDGVIAQHARHRVTA